jgi:hypothetical protein
VEVESGTILKPLFVTTFFDQRNVLLVVIQISKFPNGSFSNVGLKFFKTPYMNIIFILTKYNINVTLAFTPSTYNNLLLCLPYV